MKKITTIWKKELRDTIRDRRTLMAMIIMPIFLMPVLIVGIGKFTEYQIRQAEETIVRIAVDNDEAAPAFIDQLAAHERVDVVADYDGDIRALVRDDAFDAGLELPENFQTLVDQQQPVPVTVVRNSINTDSTAAVQRINEVAAAYTKNIIAQRFSTTGIDQSILTGITIQGQDVATKEEVGGFGLGFLLPLFIIMWSVVGGQYVAMDTSAGEKERKTLESLLLTPVRRLDIVFGKFLAVSTAALVSVVVALGSLYAAIAVFGFGDYGQTGDSSSAQAMQASGLDFSIEPMAILILFGVSVLLVLMFSAVQLSISIFAKSYKEAQSYIGPSYLVIILPTVIVNTLPNFQPAAWFFALPVVNAILLFKEVLIGTYDVTHISITVISSILYALIAIYFAAYIYRKESVLFRD